MMRFWMAASALAVLMPPAVLLARQAHAVRAAWRAADAWRRLLLVAVALLGAGWLLRHPHEERFSGLDDMTYRSLAQAFQAGRGLADADTVLASVPANLRAAFLYKTAAGSRPTRDRAFQLGARAAVDTRPFFVPILPLAAAGLPGSSTALLPILGSIWWLMLLLAGFGLGGLKGVLVVCALTAGTAWPAWFLRGAYAEGAGSVLLAAVLLSAACRSGRTAGLYGLMGFSLGIACGLHATLLLPVLPVLMVLAAERRCPRDAAWLLGSFMLGVLPLLAITRWVCQPYGDWMHGAALRRMLTGVPELRAVAWTLAVLAALAVSALVAGSHAELRRRLQALDARMRPWGWAALALAPFALIAVFPGEGGEALRSGWRATWSGIRLPYALLAAAGGAAALRRDRPFRERVLLAAFCWLTLFFLYLKGVEIPVGLWSHRRLLPVMLPLIALLAPPLASALAALNSRSLQGALLLLLVAVAGAANLVRWPVVFASVNEAGADAWTASQAERFGSERLVVFDYYPHSVPYAADLKQRVLGLGEQAHARWPAVANWLADVATTGEVWVVTSYAPTLLEPRLQLQPLHVATGRFPVVETKAFFPAVCGERRVVNHVLKAVPLAGASGPLRQDKTLDASPIGLRGPWGPPRDDGRWSRQGSGIVGPIPPAGETVVFEAKVSWYPPDPDWPEQRLTITPPWGGPPRHVAVTAGVTQVTATWIVPPSTREARRAGIYRLNAERPYDPLLYGMRGYDDDLGVLVHHISIEALAEPLQAPGVGVQDARVQGENAP